LESEGEGMVIMAFLAKSFLVLLKICKSFFMAVTQVAWGIVSLVFLNGALYYMNEKYGTDITSISPTFLKLDTWIFNNVMFFFWVFFALYLYFEIKEVISGENNENEET